MAVSSLLARKRNGRVWYGYIISVFTLKSQVSLLYMLDMYGESESGEI